MKASTHTLPMRLDTQQRSREFVLATLSICSTARGMTTAHAPHGAYYRDCRNGEERRAAAARCTLHRPYSWEELHVHAANQSARYETGEYPGRSEAGNTMYDLYKRWCVEHGRMSNAEYVLRYVHWHGGSALEPSLAPYLLEEGIEHWILWHHPDRTPGTTELNSESERRTAVLHVGREVGVRLDLDHVVCFQNVPPLRSIPTIAHSHVFLHVGRMSAASREAVANLRDAWRRRSPWLQQQQSGGEDLGRRRGRRSRMAMKLRSS